MRIISGIWKGKILKLPKYFHDRPTTDFAKEGLFSTLSSWYDFEGLRVLDLFAGSGSISYEFASRGVAEITMVEKNPKYVSFIRKQVKELFGDKPVVFNVIRDNVLDFLTHATLDYDIIFADPPFDMKQLPQLPDMVLGNNTFPQDSLFILEHPKEYDFSSHPAFIRKKHYGHVNFSFFSKSNQ